MSQANTQTRSKNMFTIVSAIAELNILHMIQNKNEQKNKPLEQWMWKSMLRV